MKTWLRILFSVGYLAVAASCSTPATRISKNAAEFSEWPEAVQEKIRAGQIDLGFTPEQVRMALGNPARTMTRTDADGTGEVWSYRSSRPRFSIGLGVGASSAHTGYGGGVGVTTGGDRHDDDLRVIFVGGRVSAIETNAKR